jgi:small G protein signaling modulator 3
VEWPLFWGLDTAVDRSGIPLVYRSKVWLECSGALEMKEPGLFQDLLGQVDSHACVALGIEKDVGRTAVGYCQGMTLVTSTLPLAHADEEEALPPSSDYFPMTFFGPPLLPSRACPLVLLDYVQEFTPKLHAYLTNRCRPSCYLFLVVPVALFTDCLLVEVSLFR